MLVISRRPHSATPASAVPLGTTDSRARRRWPWLVAAAVVLELTLTVGVALPARIDRAPTLLHANLGDVYGRDLTGLLRYLGVLVLLGAGYALAVWAVPRGSLRLAVMLVAVGGLFSLTLVAARPLYSSDVLHYVAVSRVAYVHHQNPQRTPPAAIQGDPLMLLSAWPQVPSPYGPAWTWISGLAVAGAGDNPSPTRAVLPFKLLATALMLIAGIGVVVAADHLQPGSGTRAAVLLSWSPLVALHIGGDAHNDAAMLMLIAWGCVAVVKARPRTAIVLLAMATLVKVAAVFALLALLLWMVRRRMLRAVVEGGTVALLVGVAVSARWWAGAEGVQAMLGESGYFTDTPAALLVYALTSSLGRFQAEWLVGGGLRLGLVAVLVGLVWRSHATASALLRSLTLAYGLAVTVLCAWYQPWYTLWPLTMLALLNRDRLQMPLVAALTAGALLVPVVNNVLTPILGLDVESVRADALATAAWLGPLLVAGAMLMRGWLGRPTSARAREPLPLIEPLRH